eukprot:CAMPEP_0170616862 /NCGR_PEP_ID=MMETSP0224-20130122/26096_1 /TAXON_ID=285029 /ORGANISM="Togula jolla, Strain CCCM 725" /LENGTH=707 /DNA_ID=CAMNT_0010942687 /DNA_START=17 /DNA_END=2137 /DNA_ORIENTATION=+
MAKKKHRRGTNGAVKEAAAVPEAAGPAGEVDAAPGGSCDDAGAVASADLDLDLATRAVHYIRGLGDAGEEEGGLHSLMQDALRPLVIARAAKYDEDAKAAKVAEQAAGGSLHGSRKRPRTIALPGQKLEGGTDEPDDDEVTFGDEEVAAASKTLRLLAEKPELVASKVCKALRAALHPLVEAHLRESKSSPAFRVTCMLGQRSRWQEALPLLATLRRADTRKRPKLGAYQRWVRELDVAEGDAREVAVLDAIMRLASGVPPSQVPPPLEGTLSRVPPFLPVASSRESSASAVPEAAAAAESGKASEVSQPAEGIEGGSESKCSTVGRLTALIASRRGQLDAIAKAPAVAQADFVVVAHEAALQRKPPNRFDLDIFATRSSKPGALNLADDQAAAVTRSAVPGVEGAFALAGVLSPSECSALRTASEAIGYRPDVPLSSPLDERAQNVVLLASEEQNSTLFERVRAHLPQEIEGDTLSGLNRRWRLYRYQTGNLYRKHLDGAWPASGTRIGANGRPEYVYDAGGNARSRLTFIVYLNDDFEGGCTTFFVPKPDAEGTLEARPVQPCTGCVTVFPHGETEVPLLHEGSSVSKGTKYLLRTDVVYELSQSQEAEREAARIRGLARQIGVEPEAGKVSNKAEKKLAPGKTRKVIKGTLKRKGKAAGQGEGQGSESEKALGVRKRGHKSTSQAKLGMVDRKGKFSKGKRGEK